jgi:hypothetical protein
MPTSGPERHIGACSRGTGCKNPTAVAGAGISPKRTARRPSVVLSDYG